MVGVFKNNSPANAFILLIFALAIKFPVFLYGQEALRLEGDNYIYNILLQLLHPLLGKATVIYPILAFILTFTQATLLNRLSNHFKLFPKSGYLVGMAYILITSLMKEWSYFSAPLIINSLVIWLWYLTVCWYNNSQPKSAIYNTCIIAGLLPLIYSPAAAFLLFMILALIITRPFRITEWLVGLLGLITPYYFLFVVLFLFNQWNWNLIIPTVSFHLPKVPTSPWLIIGHLLFIIPFAGGLFYVQTNHGKMLINVRKAWSLATVIPLVVLGIILFNPGNSYQPWLLFAVPFALFHAAVYYYIPSRWLASLLHWMIVAFVVAIQYMPLVK